MICKAADFVTEVDTLVATYWFFSFLFVAKTLTAVTAFYLHLLADPARDPPGFDVGRLE